MSRRAIDRTSVLCSLLTLPCPFWAVAKLRRHAGQVRRVTSRDLDKENLTHRSVSVIKRRDASHASTLVSWGAQAADMSVLPNAPFGGSLALAAALASGPTNVRCFV